VAGLELDVVLDPDLVDQAELGFEEINVLFLTFEDRVEQSRLTKSRTLSQWAIASRNSGIAACSSLRSQAITSCTVSRSVICPNPANWADHRETGCD